MTLSNLELLQITPHAGLGFGLLVFGALFTAAVAVSVLSFYLDEYWEDEDFRNQLRFGSKQANAKKRQQI